jgi:hypothetical protein
MPILIEPDFMALEVNGPVIATARFSQYAAADCNCAWIVSTTQPGCSPATRRSLP